jgi:xylulokinase
MKGAESSIDMSFLGIDCGTSALKAVLVDGEERIVAASTQTYLPSHPQPLWSEQNPNDWRDAMFAALAELTHVAPKAMGGVAAIGFSGQMHSAVLLDAADRPVRAAILHDDTRALAEARELAERCPELIAVAGVKPMAGFTAPKLLWMRRRGPGLSRKSVACCC